MRSVPIGGGLVPRFRLVRDLEKGLQSLPIDRVGAGLLKKGLQLLPRFLDLQRRELIPVERVDVVGLDAEQLPNVDKIVGGDDAGVVPILGARRSASGAFSGVIGLVF